MSCQPDLVIVTVPASSANLGSGFDCLALALDLPFGLSDEANQDDGWLALESTHPAAIAHVAAGGDPSLELRWRSPIPPGRGMGFSGAARVAGAFLAGLHAGLGEATARHEAYLVAARLEGHADNAAASALGGFAVASGPYAVSMQVPDGLSVLVWWPERSTSTNASRRGLAAEVSLGDATASIAGSALWVAAMATGELGLLRRACEDRLHQPARLAARPDAAAVLDALLGHDAVLAAWLSGSGPTIAALVPEDVATEQLFDLLGVDLLGAEGSARRLALAPHGATVHPLET